MTSSVPLRELIEEKFRTLEAKLKPIAHDVSELKEHVSNNHEERIGKLERWRSWVTGGFAFLSIMATVVAVMLGFRELLS